MDFRLIQPCEEYKESYFSYIEELGDEERYPYPMDLDYQDFPALIAKLENYSKGIDLPEWLVPNTTYWLVQDDKLVGVSHLRHYLNEQLLEAGGHIGLGIRPAYRGKGLSKLLLNLTLNEAKKLNVVAAHIHCYKDNIASARMILAVGGELESELTESDGKIVQRYIVNNG